MPRVPAPVASLLLFPRHEGGERWGYAPATLWRLSTHHDGGEEVRNEESASWSNFCCHGGVE